MCARREPRKCAAGEDPSDNRRPGCSALYGRRSVALRRSPSLRWLGTRLSTRVLTPPRKCDRMTLGSSAPGNGGRPQVGPCGRPCWALHRCTAESRSLEVPPEMTTGDWPSWAPRGDVSMTRSTGNSGPRLMWMIGDAERCAGDALGTAVGAQAGPPNTLRCSAWPSGTNTPTSRRTTPNSPLAKPATSQTDPNSRGWAHTSKPSHIASARRRISRLHSTAKGTHERHHLDTCDVIGVRGEADTVVVVSGCGRST